MDQQKENKFDELYRLLDITAKSRYRAATRLKIHGLLSQCTLSLLAIGLIISSLFTLSDMKILLDSEYVSVMQIIFSVLILTYSLLLGIGDFGVRSSDYHLCGLEISRLLRRVKPLKGFQGNHDDYKDIYNKFYNILEKYENHKDVDFISAILEIKKRTGYPDWDTKSGFWRNIIRRVPLFYVKIKLKTKILTYGFISFSHYFLSLIMVYSWVLISVIDFGLIPPDIVN